MEFKIKKILKENFNFDGQNDEIIYKQLDSVSHYKLLLLLEKEFKISFEEHNISTINKILKIINESN